MGGGGDLAQVTKETSTYMWRLMCLWLEMIWCLDWSLVVFASQVKERLVLKSPCKLSDDVKTIHANAVLVDFIE